MTPTSAGDRRANILNEKSEQPECVAGSYRRTRSRPPAFRRAGRQIRLKLRRRSLRAAVNRLDSIDSLRSRVAAGA